MKIKNFDVTVYGAGPASIFLVNKLSKLNLNIALIERGNQNHISSKSFIDKISGPFIFYKNNNLETASGFFGSAAYWKKKGVGGKLQKFDETDVLDKWPISFSKLKEKYNELINEIGNTHKIDHEFVSLNHYGCFEILKKELNIVHASGSLSYNFEKIIENYKNKILNCRNITLIENCDLVNFEYSFEKKKIINSICKLQNNENFKIQSKAHILSLGCLENNRFLLNVFKDHENYLNQYNFGKKIMFHPSMALGKYKFNKNTLKTNLIKNINLKKKILIFKMKNEKEQKILNSGINFTLNEYRSKNKIFNLYFKFVKFINEINVHFNFEHLPYEKSSVSLSPILDNNGLNKINISGSISENNIQIIKERYLYYCEVLKKIHLNNSNFYNSEFNINFETGNHHHGGLIFSNFNTPVNSDFTLKSFSNLFINGSSIFPTSSIYGPTFTIIACSYILYDNLIKKLNINN